MTATRSQFGAGPRRRRGLPRGRSAPPAARIFYIILQGVSHGATGSGGGGGGPGDSSGVPGGPGSGRGSGRPEREPAAGRPRRPPPAHPHGPTGGASPAPAG